MDLKILKFDLSKREKIIITSILISLGLLSTQSVPFYLTYKFIIGLTIFSYFLSLWALSEGMNRLKAVILLILPTLFTLAISGYYFLIIPLWMRLLAAFVFGLIFYSLLLSQNIFSISAIRTIPLYRVASTVMLIITVVTAILLFNDLFSLNLLFIYNGLIIFVLSLLLSLQLIWTVEMERLTVQIIVYSVVISLITAEVGLVLSFWPIYKPLASLMVGGCLFITSGISLDHLRGRLTKGTIWEFVGWGVLIFLIATIATSWTG